MKQFFRVKMEEINNFIEGCLDPSPPVLTRAVKMRSNLLIRHCLANGVTLSVEDVRLICVERPEYFSLIDDGFDYTLDFINGIIKFSRHEVIINIMLQKRTELLESIQELFDEYDDVTIDQFNERYQLIPTFKDIVDQISQAQAGHRHRRGDDDDDYGDPDEVIPHQISLLRRHFSLMRIDGQNKAAKQAASDAIIAKIPTFPEPPTVGMLNSIRELRRSIPEDSDVAWRNEITRIHASIYNKKRTDPILFKVTFGILYGCFLDEDDDRTFHSSFIHDADAYDEAIVEWLSDHDYIIEDIRYSTWIIRRPL
jgi:hypothetical protein